MAFVSGVSDQDDDYGLDYTSEEEALIEGLLSVLPSNTVATRGYPYQSISYEGLLLGPQLHEPPDTTGPLVETAVDKSIVSWDLPPIPEDASQETGQAGKARLV